MARKPRKRSKSNGPMTKSERAREIRRLEGPPRGARAASSKRSIFRDPIVQGGIFVVSLFLGLLLWYGMTPKEFVDALDGRPMTEAEFRRYMGPGYIKRRVDRTVGESKKSGVWDGMTARDREDWVKEIEKTAKIEKAFYGRVFKKIPGDRALKSFRKWIDKKLIYGFEEKNDSDEKVEKLVKQWEFDERENRNN